MKGRPRCTALNRAGAMLMCCHGGARWYRCGAFFFMFPLPLRADLKLQRTSFGGQLRFGSHWQAAIARSSMPGI
jgi:hypothetical protein